MNFKVPDIFINLQQDTFSVYQLFFFRTLMYPLPEKVSWYKNTLLKGKQQCDLEKDISLAFFLAPMRRVPSSK